MWTGRLCIYSINSYLFVMLPFCFPLAHSKNVPIYELVLLFFSFCFLLLIVYLFVYCLVLAFFFCLFPSRSQQQRGQLRNELRRRHRGRGRNRVVFQRLQRRRRLLCVSGRPKMLFSASNQQPVQAYMSPSARIVLCQVRVFGCFTLCAFARSCCVPHCVPVSGRVLLCAWVGPEGQTKRQKESLPASVARFYPYRYRLTLPPRPPQNAVPAYENRPFLCVIRFLRSTETHVVNNIGEAATGLTDDIETSCFTSQSGRLPLC